MRPEDRLDGELDGAGRAREREQEFSPNETSKGARLNRRSSDVRVAEPTKQLSKPRNMALEQGLQGLGGHVASRDAGPAGHDDDRHLGMIGRFENEGTDRLDVVFHDLAQDQAMPGGVTKIHDTLAALVSLNGPSIADSEDRDPERHRSWSFEALWGAREMRRVHREKRSESQRRRPNPGTTPLISALSALLSLAIPASLGCERAFGAPPQGTERSALTPPPPLPPPIPPAPAPPEQAASTSSPSPSTSSAPTAPALPETLPLKELTFDVAAPVQGKGGAVTSVESQATRIGAKILEQGGNAMDAAIATALALAVTHPSAGNLGGGGFLLVRKGPVVRAIDFREDAPAGLTEANFLRMLEAGAKTGAAVGVPGTVAGLLLAHEHFGRLPLGRLILPVETFARDGYVLSPRGAQTLVWSRADLLRDPVARRVFFQKDKPLPAGTRIKRPDLALALSRIRTEGKKGFYEGPTARDLVKSLGPDGIMTLEDLARYEARFREPLSFDFRGYRVITMPPPSGGGVVLTQILSMWTAFDPQPDDTQFYHHFAETSRRAQLERLLFVRAPERETPSTIVDLRARWLNPSTWLSSNPIAPDKKTASASLARPDIDVHEEDHTTHLSVVDAEGMAVSMTVTLSGSYGARVFSRETGIALNNSVASFSLVGKNRPEGGVRTVSSMAPTLIIDDQNTIVLGSPGGDTIPSTVALLVLRLIDRGYDFRTAVSAPRIHQGLFPDGLDIERNRPLPLATQRALVQLGHVIRRERSIQGDANIAAWLRGTCHAISDEREGGLALALP